VSREELLKIAKPILFNTEMVRAITPMCLCMSLKNFRERRHKMADGGDLF